MPPLLSLSRTRAASLSTTAATSTTTTTSSSWLSNPTNPLMRWPTLIPPLPPTSIPTTTTKPEPEPEQEEETLTSKMSTILKTPNPFPSAWSLLLSSPSPPPLSAFALLIRRYARYSLPSAAFRTFLFLHRRLPPSIPSDLPASDPFDLLVDALVKEGLTKSAAHYISLRKSTHPEWSPSVRCYNMLLHGWFRLRKLKKAEKVWEEMRRDGVKPTVVTYGTLIEGLCRMRRPDQALVLLDELRSGVDGIQPNHFTCNPIVDSLAEGGRFRDALGLVERFPLYGISPNISTYNSLVKGFVKNGDLVGASKVLKMMIQRDILPTATTYNYFSGYFAKFGKIEEGMSLYEKMVQSGYAPDRLTYQLLIKMLCEKERLGLAVQMIREMNQNGFESDLATSTMLVHLLVRLRRYDEACVEFEDMVKRGVVPQYITYRMLVKELKRLGMVEMERKLSGLMDSLPHSTKLPGSYREREGDEVVALRKSIIKKAQVISETLKVTKNPKEIDKLKDSTESAVESANRLIEDIRRRVYAVKSK